MVKQMLMKLGRRMDEHRGNVKIKATKQIFMNFQKIQIIPSIFSSHISEGVC